MSNSLDPDQARLLIGVQTVCKSYQQRARVGKSQCMALNRYDIVIYAIISVQILIRTANRRFTDC